MSWPSTPASVGSTSQRRAAISRFFDIDAEGVAVVGHDSPGDGAHTVAVDPDTHHLFFPFPDGGGGTPMLRIMRPRE